MLKDKIILSEEVKEAIANNTPIVVLESTIITHGMPFPQNEETAIMLETLCRKQGVTPATIALYNGYIHVGLENDILTKVAQSQGVEKVSVRDIAYCLATNKTGGTTVAATSLIASLVNLKVFATGGVGGVHRGVSATWDMSADLVSLKESNIIVVSAGAKAILDLPKTLEVLESYNVPVLGYQTSVFPAFYTRETNLPVRRVDDVTQIANIFKINHELGIDTGILVANPIPASDELKAEVINPLIEEAIIEADNLGIKGKDVTPFLLQKLYEISDGNSLASNIELVKNNVNLACSIAKELY